MVKFYDVPLQIREGMIVYPGNPSLRARDLTSFTFVLNFMKMSPSKCLEKRIQARGLHSSLFSLRASCTEVLIFKSHLLGKWTPWTDATVFFCNTRWAFA